MKKNYRITNIHSTSHGDNLVIQCTFFEFHVKYNNADFMHISKWLLI